MRRIKKKNPNTTRYWKKHWGNVENLDFNFRYKGKAETGLIIAEKAVGKILDVACGSGMISKYFNPDCVCDLSEDAVEYVKRKLKTDGFQCDVRESLPVPDKSYDTVVATEIIEHLNSPKKLIKDLERVAREKVIITAPAGEYSRTSKEHVWEFEENDLVEMFSGKVEVYYPDKNHFLIICSL